MKIWVDIANSPHVEFFQPLLREDACEYVVTARPLANTLPLLEQAGISYEVVGRHYGGNLAAKTVGLFLRSYALWSHLRPRELSVAVSHNSFYSPLAARFLRIPSLYITDNEHAFANKAAFAFATRIMVPECLKGSLRGNVSAKFLGYPGVKEGIYLWDHPAARVGVDVGRSRKSVYVRPEPPLAHYYAGAKGFLDHVLVDLARDCEVVVLPRGEEQAAHYGALASSGVHVATEPIPLTGVRRRCDLFLGAGGTMTREAAVLGIPTLSVYQGELLAVDRYLMERGKLEHLASPSAEAVRKMLHDSRHTDSDASLLEDGHRAYCMIRDELSTLACAGRRGDVDDGSIHPNSDLRMS